VIVRDGLPDQKKRLPITSRHLSASLDVTGQQPVDTDLKLFLNANQNLCGRADNPPLILRKLTLTDAKLPSEFVLSDVEPSQLPDPSPEGLHVERGDFSPLAFLLDGIVMKA
jgi:hypothetical protein